MNLSGFIYNIQVFYVFLFLHVLLSLQCHFVAIASSLKSKSAASAAITAFLLLMFIYAIFDVQGTILLSQLYCEYRICSKLVWAKNLRRISFPNYF